MNRFRLLYERFQATGMPKDRVKSELLNDYERKDPNPIFVITNVELHRLAHLLTNVAELMDGMNNSSVALHLRMQYESINRMIAARKVQ